MKYLVAMAILAAPLAMATVPSTADAAPRDGYRCQMVKKKVWSFGKLRNKWVKVCKPRHHRRHHRH